LCPQSRNLILRASVLRHGGLGSLAGGVGRSLVVASAEGGRQTLRKGFDTLVWLVALEREEPSRPRAGGLAAGGPRWGHFGGRVSLD
jgi:hypothetical protein